MGVQPAERGGLGLITLDRPEALNALNHPMVSAVSETLARWRRDDNIHTVAVVGAGDRGLCAGGDILSIYHDAKAGARGVTSAPARFWHDEYLLNAAIARYPKPYVAMMDGIVMGGGVGVSAHGSHRIVTERSRVGMPETGIGFVPDVGGTYLLCRAPGEIGTHIALTAATMDAGDAIAVGFADYFVPSERISRLLDSLTEMDPDAAIAAVAEPAPPSALAAQQDWINSCYNSDSVEKILELLATHAAPEAHHAAAAIRTKSPTALKATLRALRDARSLTSLESTLIREYRTSVASLAGHDLVEGIRAQIVDKDRTPQWDPATLADVGPDRVDRYFAALGNDDLRFEKGQP